MDDDVIISRAEAAGQMQRLRNRTTQWRRSHYRDGWNDAIDSAESALNNCRPLDAEKVVCCRNCFHATDRESTLVYCSIQKRHKKLDAYCDEGTAISEFE